MFEMPPTGKKYKISFGQIITIDENDSDYSSSEDDEDDEEEGEE